MKLLTFSVVREGFIGCLLYQSKTSLYISVYLLPQSGSPKYATLYVLIVPIFSWKIQHFCTYDSEKIYTFQRQSFGTSGKLSLNPLQIDAMKTPVKFSQIFLKNSLFMRFSQNSLKIRSSKIINSPHNWLKKRVESLCICHQSFSFSSDLVLVMPMGD